MKSSSVLFEFETLLILTWENGTGKAESSLTEETCGMCRDICEVSIGDGFGGLWVHFQGIFRGKLAAGSGTWYNKGNFKNQ